MSSISFPLISFNDTLCIYLFFFFILCWLSWSFTFVPFAKFFFSSLSFNLAFSPTFIFYPAHSPVCSHFCHSSSFSLDWFLDFHSFLIILFCSFTVLYGCVVIFLPFPSAFRDFLSSSCCILHLCLFCPAAFYTFSQYAVIYFITFISLICLISLPLKRCSWLMCLLLLSVICNQVLVQCRGCCAGLSCGRCKLDHPWACCRFEHRQFLGLCAS